MSSSRFTRCSAALMVATLAAPAWSAAPNPSEELAAQVPAMRAVLDGWQATAPAKAERSLQLVYWTPADREPAPRHRERLSKIMEDIRSFYAREMERNGFGPRTLRLVREADGLCKIHLVRSAKPYAEYNVRSGADIRKECVPVLRAAGLDPDNETLVIFCNMANWDAARRTISQNSPYYASGTFRSGTAWQVDSPILDLDSLGQREQAVQDGQYGKISLGRYNSIFIGGIAHELGHALGLPHCAERADQRSLWGTSLMGGGNRTYGEQLRGEGKGSFLTLAEAARLASHPMFSGSVKGFDAKPGVALRDIKFQPQGKSFTFSARVQADPPAYAVVGYTDPAGHSDYDATTSTAVPDKDGRFTLRCDALTPGLSGVLRVVVAQANGSMSSFATVGAEAKYPYVVAADGTVDLAAAQAQLQLAPLIVAVNARNAAGAAEELKRLANAPAPVQETARAFAATVSFKPGPAPAVAAGDRCALSEATTRMAKVGYDRPHFNRLPGGSPLLTVGSKLFARGLYAHAPAQHAWELGGKWSRLTGSAGLADGAAGSVIFSITADGRELWRSKLLKSGEVVAFDVPVKDAKLLELLVSDGGDGIRGDSGVWLEPTLQR